MSSGRTGALERQADGRRLEQGPRIGVLDAGNNTSQSGGYAASIFTPELCVIEKSQISHQTVAYMLPWHSRRNRHSLK